MNLLTGKAKEDFINYVWSSSFEKEDYKEYENYLDNQKENHTYSDIIGWLDSVGMVIGLTYFKLGGGYFEWRIHYTRYFGKGDSRHEATTESIKQSNIIYNEN